MACLLVRYGLRLTVSHCLTCCERACALFSGVRDACARRAVLVTAVHGVRPTAYGLRPTAYGLRRTLRYCFPQRARPIQVAPHTLLIKARRMVHVAARCGALRVYRSVP